MPKKNSVEGKDIDVLDLINKMLNAGWSIEIKNSAKMVRIRAVIDAEGHYVEGCALLIESAWTDLVKNIVARIKKFKELESELTVVDVCKGKVTERLGCALETGWSVTHRHVNTALWHCVIVINDTPYLGEGHTQLAAADIAFEKVYDEIIDLQFKIHKLEAVCPFISKN